MTKMSNPREEDVHNSSSGRDIDRRNAREGQSVAPAMQPPKGRGYQEARRYDRDRRDRRKKDPQVLTKEEGGQGDKPVGDKYGTPHRDSHAAGVDKPGADSPGKDATPVKSSDSKRLVARSLDHYGKGDGKDSKAGRGSDRDTPYRDRGNRERERDYASSKDKERPDHRGTRDREKNSSEDQYDRDREKASRDRDRERYDRERVSKETDRGTRYKTNKERDKDRDRGVGGGNEKHHGSERGIGGSSVGQKPRSSADSSRRSGRERDKDFDRETGKLDRHTEDTYAKDGGAELLSLIKHGKESKGSRERDRGERGKPKTPGSSSKHSGSSGGGGGGGGAGGAGAGGQELKGKGKTASDLEAQWQKEAEERQKKEEEERRIAEEKQKEEERIQAEEERKRQEEEELLRIKEEERKMLEDYITETKDRITWKMALREKNISAAENRPDDSFSGKLDSSLKKNTAFVKRIRNLTESQKDALEKDFHGLNLSKYIGEVAVAITEAKLKMADIPCGIHLCSLMHQRYADFSPTLLENWQKVLLTKKDEKVPNPSKLRVDFRFFADLVAVGVFKQKVGLSLLAAQLTFLIGNDKDDHNNLTIVLSFCKHCGDDYAGLLARKNRLLAEKYEMEIPRSQMLPAERQKACRGLLKEYFASMCRHLERDHHDLCLMDRQNRKILQTKGELSAERKDQHEVALNTFQKLQVNSATFADLMDDDLPDLPEEEFKPDPDGMGLDIYSPMKSEYDGDSSLFEDEDTRQFYENFPDLKAIIPGILYKDSEQAVAEAAAHDMALEEDLESLELEELELAADGMELMKEAEEDAADAAAAGGGSQAEQKEMTPEVEDEVDDLLPPEAEDDDSDIGSSMKLILECYLGSLPSCVNRELIDKSAADFCMNLNTKANRKKLIRTLFTVHRTRYDLLPFYSRLVATLHPCMPDVATELVTLLKGDFRWHVRKKDQINIESKLKTVRFIGEMVKFKMFPKAEALHCMKMLMFDFNHHNIEMACSLLETCGRFLYRSPDSHHRTKVYLEVMMRKKAALHYDSRYSTMIENAYYYSNPPDLKREARVERPPMHQYIRKLLYKDLSKITTEKVLKQMRKLSWDDHEISAYAVKCVAAIWNVRYNCVHCCANLLAGLAPYQENVAIQVIDAVVENIRLGLEINHPKYNQQRVSSVKFLGELYNYRMVESGVIFKTLYTFISFGVDMEETTVSLLDPPEHLFRLRLTCVMLDTCAQYFDRGSSKRKLDCFLLYFQRYYWFKRKNPIYTAEWPFPMDIEYMVQDSMEMLRPKKRLAESYEEACAAITELETEFKAKIAEVLPVKMMDEGADEAYDNLPTIQESEEADDLSQVPLTDETQQSDGDADGEDRTGSQSQTAEDRDEDEEEGRGRHRGGKDRQQEQEGEDAGEGARDGADSDEDEEEVLMDSEEDDEEVKVLTGGVKVIQCMEDDDFMAAFDKMMADNIQARNQEPLKVPQVEIAVPMHATSHPKTKSVTFPTGVLPAGLTPPGSSPPPGATHSPPSPPPTLPSLPQEGGSINTISFVLMTKKGNKQQFSKLNVPLSEGFASKFKEQAQAERAEKERMKRVVLDFHERQEEEDYQEIIAAMNRPATVNTNRERRIKYQHPKGAPDADLIFGNKVVLRSAELVGSKSLSLSRNAEPQRAVPEREQWSASKVKGQRPAVTSDNVPKLKKQARQSQLQWALALQESP